MDFCRKTILLLIFSSFMSVGWGESIGIPHKMMNQNTTLNIPIFIYDVLNLEYIQLKIEYDTTIVFTDEIIEDPVGILNGGYTFTTNLTEPGIIHIGIGSNSANLFTGSGMIAQIVLQSIGSLGEVSSLTFLDAQINSNWQIPAVNGSIEIILDELIITGQDESEIVADDFIRLGMCEGCTDGWSFAEDEYDYPNPFSGEFANIHFFHPEWVGEADTSNGVVCTDSNIATDKRNQHSFNELISWGIRGFRVLVKMILKI